MALRSRATTSRVPCCCLLSGLLLMGSCSPERAAGDSSELVAFVIVDTLRRDALGCYGNDRALTPIMDGLAEEGVRFEQAISASGWTLPSVASMLTGTWPSMHKALGKNTRLTPISEDLPLAAEVFAAQGYRTIGFANAAFLSPLLGLDRGFEVFDHEHAYNKEIRRADTTVAAALATLGHCAGEKVFMLIHLFDAHLNYDPPEGFIAPFVPQRRSPDPPLNMAQCLAMQQPDGGPPSQADIDYMRALYQGEIAFVDQALGLLVDGLKQLGRWEHTTLVITSDHGEEFWEHGGFEHGHSLYDELVRVPLIFRLPPANGLAVHGIERQVRTIDIMPSLFELAGFAPAPSFIGQSFAAEFGGAAAQGIPAAFSQGTLYGREKLSWRQHGYCLIMDQALEGSAAFELYDLELDPLQLNDISRENPELTQKLFLELSSFSKDLIEQGKRFSTPELRSMGPGDIEIYKDSIEKLGYTGRDSE